MRLVLEKARVSFAQSLFDGQTNDDGSISYSCQLLIPKGGPAVKKVMETMTKVAIEKWGAAKGPATLKALIASGNVFIHNGDEKPDYDGYDGNMFVTVRSNTKPNSNPRAPKLLNKNKSPVTQDQGTLYSGCYVYAVLEVKALDKTLKNGTKVKRISCYISGLMVVEDGESLGGSAPAKDEDFPDIADTGDALGIGDDMPVEEAAADSDLEALLNG